MFKEEREQSMFEWNMLGDSKLGRPNLGASMSVDVYRLMQFTLRDTMIRELGVEKTDTLFFDAGKKAGEEYFLNIVKEAKDVSEFALKLQKSLKELGIGILRVEEADLEKMHFIITVAEDLDCSGLPVTDEQICVYDEGFVSGLFTRFTGVDFHAKEIDCWCSGDRVCRFEVSPL